MVRLEKSWLPYLEDEFQKPYMLQLKAFLKSELQQGKVIYPHGSEIFSAFDFCPFEQLKVVIIGQDPYHGPGQAHGLCFSVKPGVTIPPSLRNIYKELEADLGITPAKDGYLERWARQGILMINAVLTVEAHKAASHQGKGWEIFTDRVVEVINQEKEGIIFVLWGSFAQKKALKLIDPKRHHIIKGPHPSPLSAHRGFFGCRHFSKINQLLKEQGKSPILF